MIDKLKLETLLMHYGEEPSDFHGAVVPPIYQNSLFTFDDWDALNKAFDDRKEHFIYTRGKNPTVSVFEKKIAKIAGGEKAQLFPSGMAAISAAIMHCVKSGDHIITINNIYGPANNLLQSYLKPKFGIDITYISGTNLNEFEKAVKPNTTLIYLESPSSAIFSLQDIKGVAEMAKDKGVKTIIDNTWATPIFQKPLEMGIDIEVHSCSKYIGGHSDVVAGVVIGSVQEIDDIFLKEYEWIGAKIAPFEAWLLLRSLRTLPLRMKQHQESGITIANYLEMHDKVVQVNYPGLESFSQYELGRSQMSGTTGLMSFRLETENLEKIKEFYNHLKIFRKGVSWGGHESLIYAPAISYLKELTDSQFEGMGISLSDMRISVGLENADDLIADLEEAFEVI